jgi:hypothetical protein
MPKNAAVSVPITPVTAPIIATISVVCGEEGANAVRVITNTRSVITNAAIMSQNP